MAIPEPTPKPSDPIVTLQRELEGLWSASRGPYRVVYEIEDEAKTVNVVRIDHRADVYRPR